MPAGIVKNRSKEPLKAVKDAYGSIEEFTMILLDVCPGYLEGEYGANEAAEALELPLSAFTRAVSTPEFNETLDQLASFSEYSYDKRRLAMRNLAKIATTAQKLTISRSGKPVTVDRDADEIIKADTHLRKVQKRPLDKPEKGIGSGITIIFGGAAPNAQEEIIVEAADDNEDAGTAYKPNGLGELPPPGARRFYGDDDPEEESGESVLSEFNFNGEKTEKSNYAPSVAAAKDFGPFTGEGDEE